MVSELTLWFLNQSSILFPDVFIEGTCYFMDSYPFNLFEDLCEEFRKIYGDPIYDTYDDEDFCKMIYGPPIYDDYVAIVAEEAVEIVNVKDGIVLPKFELGAGCNNWETQTLTWTFTKQSPIEGLLRDQAFRYKGEYAELICTLSVAFPYTAQGHVHTSFYIIMESACIPQFFMARLIHRYAKVNIDEVCQNCLLASQEFCYGMAGKDILSEEHG